MRRIAFATLLALAVLLVGALPAAADITASIQSPSAGQEITSSVGSQVRVQRSLLDPEVAAVQLRLVRDGSPTSAAGLSCIQGCGGSDQTWGQLAIDPRSPDEFGVTHPLANGGWTVQTRWQDGGGAWSVWGGDVDVTVSVPPSPVTGLTSSADLRDVTLSWTRAPEPDISAYRIQRRPDGGSWSVIGSVGSEASSYQDTTPASATYEYRVVTVRPDGHGSVLTATSSSTTVTTTSSSASSPSDDGTTSSGGTSDGGTTSDGGGTSDGGTTSDDGSTTTDDGASSDGTDGSTSDGADGSASGDGATTTDGDDGGSTSTRTSSGRRIAAPPGVRTGSSLDIDARLPDPEVAPQAERYYGEGEGFSEELDYSGAEPILPGEGDADGRSVLQRIPGGVQEFIVSRFETRTLLRSIAAGLLFVALGLHAYRWMHATPND